MVKIRANLKCSPGYENIEKADMIRTESRARKLNFDEDNQVPRFCSRFLFLTTSLILSHITYVLFGGYTESEWAYLIEINFSDDFFRLVLSFDGNFYICNTSRKKLNKNFIPCHAVCNMLEACEFPKEFRDIQRFKRVLIARQLLFKKVSIILKGQSPKLKYSS